MPVEHHTMAAAESLAPDASRSFARFVSNIFSPPLLALPIVAIGASHAGQRGAWHDALLFAVIAMVVPLLDLGWRLHAGRIDDIHLPVRSDRTRAFAVSVACSAVALTVLWLRDAAPLLVALGMATVVQFAVLFAITLYWQISVHAAASASLAVVAMLLLGSSEPVTIAAAVLLPLVAWARIHLDRHTPAQVAAGALVGAGVSLVVLAGLLP